MLLFNKPIEMLGSVDLSDDERTGLETISRDEFDKIAVRCKSMFPGRS